MGLGDMGRERAQQFGRRPGPTGVAGIHQSRQRRGHQIGLDRGSRGRVSVALVRVRERARFPQRRLGGRDPHGEVNHTRQAFESDVRKPFEPVSHCVEQRAEDAWTLFIERGP